MRNPASLVLLAVAGVVAHESHQAIRPDVFEAKHYDVIVVGGGSAGSVLGTRLSENPQVDVLVIEAGPASHSVCGGKKVVLKCYLGEECLDGPDAEYTPFDIPLWAQQGIDHFTWGERYPDGVAKVLGGSGLMNGMSFYRGHPLDFDSMRGDFGLSGWDWATVKEYYKKTEGYRGAFEHDTETHNLNGPLRVTDIPPDPSIKILHESACNAGFRCGIDLNGPDRVGFAWRAANMRDGRRDSTAKSMLCPAMGRHNLDVLVETEVTQLLIEQDGRDIAVVGVRYVVGEGENKKFMDVRAKTVVLSAGVFGTPFLLMKSGIGPREQLEALNIPVVVDLQGVGKNFRDDISIQIGYEFIRLDDPPRLGTQSSEASIEWMTTGGGDFTAGTNENGFILSENATAGDRPTTMFRRRPFTGTVLLTLQPPGGGPPTEIRLREDGQGITRHILGPVPDRDIEELAYGIEVARRIAAHPPMVDYQREISPGPTVRTRDQLKDWVRSRWAFFHHSQGTAKMGLASDPLAVVDDHFKVHGVKEGTLWVSDNCVFPLKIQSDSYADAVMAGERGADFVKEFFRW